MQSLVEDLGQDDLNQLKAINTINWKVVERFRRKFGYDNNFEMTTDWALFPDLIYARGLKPRPNPFHRHVRLNLDKCLLGGVSTFDEVIERGLKLSSAQLRAIKESEVENSDDDA
jgi:hypothetical protein